MISEFCRSFPEIILTKCLILRIIMEYWNQETMLTVEEHLHLRLTFRIFRNIIKIMAHKKVIINIILKVFLHSSISS